MDDETFRLALEDWAIWRRWEEAFHAGQTTSDTHPALPADRARHDELTAVLTERLAALGGTVTRAHAEFRVEPGNHEAGRGRALEVRWTRVETFAT